MANKVGATVGRGHSTSVGGRNYILHLVNGEKTFCGRIASRVNCGIYKEWAGTEGLCRVCETKVAALSKQADK